MKRILRVSARLAMAVFIALVCLNPNQARAEFPDKTITIYMPFGTGGLGDVMLRFLADIMKEDLGVPVVVVNKPGSGGAVGWTLLQAAKPDGYSIGYASNSIFLQTVRTNGALDYKNFTPIVGLNFTPFAVTVNAEAPWNTLQEFVEYAKANPGKVRVGNSGTGAIFHISALAFEKAAGLNFTHVPYKSGSETASALMGGHIEASSITVSDMGQLVESGKLRVLAMAGEKRDPYYPDVPTLKELGYEISLGNWRGVFGPKGIPEDRVKILADAFEKAVEDPRWKEFAEKQKIVTVFDRGASLNKFYATSGDTMFSILKEMK